MPVFAWHRIILGPAGYCARSSERNAKPVEKPAKLSEAAQLRLDMKAFSETATNLAPAEAAKRWLEFVDRTMKIQQAGQNRNSFADQIDANDVLAALPLPETWSGLAKAVMVFGLLPKSGVEMHEFGFRFLVSNFDRRPVRRARR